VGGYGLVKTAAYQWISDSGLGPKFLGHVTKGKGGRVVGFVTALVEGTRAAGPGARRPWDGCMGSVSS